MKKDTPVARSEELGVEGPTPVVFRIAGAGPPSMRGQWCGVWETSVALRLGPVKMDPFRDARCGRLPLLCV